MSIQNLKYYRGLARIKIRIEIDKKNVIFPIISDNSCSRVMKISVQLLNKKKIKGIKNETKQDVKIV